MFRYIQTILITIILIGSVAKAATQGNITLTGTVPAITSITLSNANADLGDLNDFIVADRLVIISNMVLNNNIREGYRLRISSQNSGHFTLDGPTTVESQRVRYKLGISRIQDANYTIVADNQVVKDGGLFFNLSTEATFTQTSSTPLINGFELLAVEPDEANKPLVSGDYSDVLTFTIEAL